MEAHPCAGGVVELFAYEQPGYRALFFWLIWRPASADQETAHARQPSAAPSQEPTAAVESAQPSVAFVHQGKRDFRSSCHGAYPQVTKGQAADFQAGKPLRLTCPTCGKSGTATKS